MTMQQSEDVKHYREVQQQMVARAVSEWSPYVSGAVVAITGGARGIGRVLAEGLQKAGASVACADIGWKGAEAFKESLNKSKNGIAVDADITSHDAVTAAYDKIIAKFGRVDVLVNNAGLVSETLFAPKGHVPTLETKAADWERIFGVNVFGTVDVIRTFSKSMLENHRGSIITVVSSGVLMESVGGGFFGARPWTKEMPYQSTKAALTAMTFYLAEEQKKSGIAVNAFMPGHTRASWFDATADAFRKEGRVYALRPMAPQHVLPLVLFLAAQASPTVLDQVTGRLYHVPDWLYDHGFGGLRSWGDYDLPDEIEAGYRRLEAVMPDYWRSGLARARFDAERVAYGASVQIASLQQSKGR